MNIIRMRSRVLLWPTIYYEGDYPVEFIEEIKERFGFDIEANNPDWMSEYRRYESFGFECPPQHLNAICRDYEMGT